jgi:hypothetical protein
LLQLPTLLGLFAAVVSLFFSAFFFYTLERGRCGGVFLSKMRAFAAKHSLPAFFGSS